MAVVYRHIRLDKNVPFYIGIGDSINRAYNKINRTKIWKNIAKKGYETSKTKISKTNKIKYYAHLG